MLDPRTRRPVIAASRYVRKLLEAARLAFEDELEDRRREIRRIHIFSHPQPSSRPPRELVDAEILEAFDASIAELATELDGALEEAERRRIDGGATVRRGAFCDEWAAGWPCCAVGSTRGLTGITITLEPELVDCRLCRRTMRAAGLLSTATEPAPSWIRPGVPIWYHPHVGARPRYLGIVAGEPWLLGETLVVRLERMEHGYRKPFVAAAAIDALEPLGLDLRVEYDGPGIE